MPCSPPRISPTYPTRFSQLLEEMWMTVFTMLLGATMYALVLAFAFVLVSGSLAAVATAL